MKINYFKCLSLSLFSINGAIEAHTAELNFLKQFISPSALVFDVGANVGSKTDLYLDLGAHVVCFEPQKECISTLEGKFKTNSNVKIETIGLADKLGQIEMFICSQTNTISTCAQDWTEKSRFVDMSYNWPKKVFINVDTLDHMIEKYGTPEFIKIDVENFELDVLKGLSSSVPYLSFEFTQEYFLKSTQCVKYLESIGFNQFNFALAEIPELASSKWVSGSELVIIIDSLIQEKKREVVDWIWGDIYAKR